MACNVVIVQARYGSSRLTGKVLMDLAGCTVLEHVLRRCLAIDGIDGVCCAVADDTASDSVAEEARRIGVEVCRGSESDVLSRYYKAARALRADVVMRVTSDCPVIDPDVCASVLTLREVTGADYACNNMPPSWPHGLDVEVFTFAALERMQKVARLPEQREHVTPWLRAEPGLVRANLPGPGGKTALHRWTLDYPEDLTFFRALFEKLATTRFPGGTRHADLDIMLATLQAYPGLDRINENRRGPR